MDPMPPTPTSKASRRDRPPRERILLTAHHLFYRDGIRATGIDRVIELAEVTKVTFYRHFPSKNDLIFAYLEYRHERWMSWFVGALRRHGGTAQALVPTMAEWFRSPEFRGCAFINGVSEFASALPQITEITRRHKSEMKEAIAALLAPSRRRQASARALALVLDGSIVEAQFSAHRDRVLRTLGAAIRAITSAGSDP
jgi:AcrR family transcriptional regulator